jgi:hypothetical protein
MVTQRVKRLLVGVLLLGSAGASLMLITLVPATANAQGPAPTLIPGVPVITAPAVLPTLDPTQFPTNGTPEPPSGSPGGNPAPQPPASPIQQIIRYFFQIFFPANTFREAIEGATRAIFEGTVEDLREPLTVVMDVAIFQNGAVFGNVALPGELSAVADIMTRAAVPLWALSLALMALSVLTRQAVGMGYGSNEIAAEAARWFFIALASGNGFVLVGFVHSGFGLLAREIAGLNRVSAGAMVDALLRGAIDTPIIILIIMIFIAIITIFVVIITYVARYAVTLAIAALAPVAIACEGIPYLRFVCRDWLSMFLRAELLQIVNVCVLVLFGHMMLFGGADGLVGSILRMVAMVGLASALIAINTAAFKQVFGVAIEAAQQMRMAVEQLVGGLAAVAGMALTGSPAPMLGMARPSDVASRAGQEPALLTGNSSDGSGGDARAADGFAGASSRSSNGASQAAQRENADASSSHRVAYRLGNAGASSADATTQQPHRAERQADSRDHAGDQSTANASSGHADSAGLSGAGSKVERQPSTSDAASQSNSLAVANQGAQHTTASALRQVTQSSATDGASSTSTQYPSSVSEDGVWERAGTDANASDRPERGPVSAVTTRNQVASTARTDEASGPQTQSVPNAGTGEQGVASALNTQGAQPTSASGQIDPARADLRSTVSQAGGVARAVSRTTRMGGLAGAALRGFGEGTLASDWMQRQMSSGMDGFGGAPVSDELKQARGERFARYTLGADSPDDARYIAGQLTSPSEGASVRQMQQAYEAVAPIARDMARQYGSPTRAAAQGGYGSYGEMATALATERLRAQGQSSSVNTAVASGAPGPVESWTSTTPGPSQGMTPYDYGMGAMVSGQLGAHPATAPEWARTVQSLRQASGDHTAQGTVLNRFVDQMQAGQFGNERDAMRWLETAVQQQPASNGQSIDLWWHGSSPPHTSHERAGVPQYDAGQNQAERFARFTLGAETPSDVHVIASQLLNSDGGQSGYSSAQMREAFEAIAPLARDMSRQFGSATRAAAIGGYDSYGQLVTAMAEEHLRMRDVLPTGAQQSQSSPPAGPIETWSAMPPGQGTTSQGMTPYDYGMGGFVAGQLGASAGAKPEWVRTMFSLRQAYGDHSMGESVFTEFVQRVGNRQFETERAARTWLEQQVEAHAPTSGRSVHLWWRASAKPNNLPNPKSSGLSPEKGGSAQ